MPESSLAADATGHAPQSASATAAARAREASAIAARHAGAVDEQARFPSEAFDALRAQRLLGIALPAALGGEGAPLGEIADVCYRLAQGCASTAMIYAMHQIKVACLMRHYRANVTLEALLRRIATEQLLLASSTTEGQGGGNVRASEAPVQHEGDRISLERAASVISYGADADGIVTTARRSAEAAASDQVLVVFLKSDYSLTRLQGWSTLGMRGTCSDGYLLKATGSAGQILPDAYELIHAQTMVPTAHLLWGSVWAGIAAGALTRAQGFVRHVVRHAQGQMPPGAAQFTQALRALRTLRGALANALRTYESVMDDPQALAALSFQTMITLIKVEASEAAVAIVLQALRVCGLAGYRRDGEFSIERALRDVLSAPLMINNERILANLANASVLAPVPGTLRD